MAYQLKTKLSVCVGNDRIEYNEIGSVVTFEEITDAGARASFVNLFLKNGYIEEAGKVETERPQPVEADTEVEEDEDFEEETEAEGEEKPKAKTIRRGKKISLKRPIEKAERHNNVSN